MSFSNKYIFLDTNVFIHCKDFTRIQWKNLFKELKITINLFIPEIVLDELDDLGHILYNLLILKIYNVISVRKPEP